ncbi:DEAD/DEAH box helicase [Bdellovibrionota bacterium FG-2]
MLELRPFQKQALALLQNPGHILAIAPTGSGKSLIIERRARCAGTRTLLISPLIALSRQHADKLGASGLKVQNGPLNGTKYNSTPDVWILSPESLTLPATQERLRLWNPNFLAVDECHCLWEWGQSFRPAFLEIPFLIEKFKIPTSLWLTATLPTPGIAQLENLVGRDLIKIGDFALPEKLGLSIAKVPWLDRTELALEWIGAQQGCGIIFVQTRRFAENLCRGLQAAGKRSLHYHAGLSKEERLNLEHIISRGDFNLVVATSAFGMGMDIPHLRWCLVWQAPASLLALAQAIGRVGRSEFGSALVFWDDQDFENNEWITANSAEKREDLQNVLRFFKTTGCRKEALSKLFRAHHFRPCNQCDHCIGTILPNQVE